MVQTSVVESWCTGWSSHHSGGCRLRACLFEYFQAFRDDFQLVGVGLGHLVDGTGSFMYSLRNKSVVHVGLWLSQLVQNNYFLAILLGLFV